MDQQPARFGRRAAQGAGAGLNSRAAGGSALVAGERRIAHDDVDLVDGDVELVGDDLRDGDVERLAHVHLAEEGGDAAVRQDRHPGIELGRDERRFAGGGLRKALPDAGGSGRGHDERPGRLQEFAAGK